MCDFLSILSVIGIEFLSRTSVHEGRHCFTMRSRVHSTHAFTIHACAVVELRFVNEHTKNKNKAECILRAFPSESPSNYIIPVPTLTNAACSCTLLAKEKVLLLRHCAVGIELSLYLVYSRKPIIVRL